MSRKTRKSKLVTNLSSNRSQKSTYQNFVINLEPVSVREEELEGVKHLVVPAVITTECVMNGSEGPLFYPAEELSKTPESWDHKPITVDHPTMNGRGVSACKPGVVNARKIGLMMNTAWDDRKGRLTTECYINPAKCATVDQRVLDAIESKTAMELSSGVFVDNDGEAGLFGARNYVGVARNYRPDHLAILPDKIGACSKAMGAGFIRNSKGLEVPKDALQEFMENYQPTEVEVVTNDARSDTVKNELSFDNIRSQLNDLLAVEYGDGTSNCPCPCYVNDVYDSSFVYRYEGKLYKLGYSIDDDDQVTLEDKPVQVVQVTSYEDMNGKPVTNDEAPARDMNRAVHVLQLRKLGRISDTTAFSLLS